MTSTPKIGAPLWTASDETPWLGANKADRLFDAFTMKTSVIDRDLTAPPGSCADGARYLVAAGATGAWAGKDGHLAIAHGTNAVSGWIFCPLEIEGMMIRIEDENIVQLYHGGWTTPATPPQRMQDFPDVDLTGLVDGNVLKWDASNGVWYAGSDVAGDAPAAFRGASVRKATNLTGQNYTTETTISWDTETYDTDNIHDNSVNPSRLTVPDGVSKVRLHGQVRAANAGANEWLSLQIYKNGSTAYAGCGRGASYASGTSPGAVAYSGILPVTAGDYFELKIQVQTDTSVDILADNSGFAMEIIE